MSADILVLGYKGWLGSAVFREAESRGFKVTGFDIETGQDALSLLQLREEMLFSNIVINCMGRVREAVSREKPYYYWRNNLMAAVEAFELTKQLGSKLIHVSSAAYGWWDNPYAASKSAADIAAQQYCQLGANITIARLHNPYGPGQPEDFAVPLLMRKIAKQEVISIGSNVRDYIYVDDVAEILVRATKESPRAFEIGNGIGITDLELALSIGEVIGEEPRFGPDLGGQPTFRCAESTDACRGSTSLKEGLTKTWEWLKL